MSNETDAEYMESWGPSQDIARVIRITEDALLEKLYRRALAAFGVEGANTFFAGVGYERQLAEWTPKASENMGHADSEEEADLLMDIQAGKVKEAKVEEKSI